MVFNTATVAGVVTPAVIQTFLSHYFDRKSHALKPTAHISYDEGLHLVRKFLLYASHHTVEDIQRFTSQWVPCPHWVKLDHVTIPGEHLAAAADAIRAQLGPHGIEMVGGETWWQWRRPGGDLKAEWIEMRSDFQERSRTNDPVKRVMLYVHGGAYFFGSVDAHRYQLQRHARKLKARVLARYVARYRLAPQFPFPCGLYDCLSAYLYLLTLQDPTTIILAGDSAGGGMVLSMLVTLRDQGIPLPAGAILISPWVDLTHSFPSVAGDGSLDYIPPHGFHQRPSPSWPPPTIDDMLAMKEASMKRLVAKDQSTGPQQTEADAVQGFRVDHKPDPSTQNATAATATTTNGEAVPVANTVAGPGRELSIMINGKLIEIKDQIQMYATNQLITHPLVSPALQQSLGGLPPLLILTGGGELLRDEQIYVAHKAANPTKYPAGDKLLDEVPRDHGRNQIDQWKPTNVQLQVWDDLCHVPPTLSFTRPAKYMFRSVAQFGAWALARAQKTEIEIVDDDAVSVISRSDSDSEDRQALEKKHEAAAWGQVGKAGDSLPPFRHHMIRERVDRHGNISALEPESELPGCNLPAKEIGVIKEGTVQKWMAAKRKWDTRFASTKRKVQKQRAMEFAKGYQTFGDGETPPPSALAGRRRLEGHLAEEKKKQSKALSLWALWGSNHDEKAIEHEQEANQAPDVVAITDGSGGATKSPDQETTQLQPAVQDHSRSRSRRRIVTDEHQTEIDEDTPAAVLHSRLVGDRENVGGTGQGLLTPKFLAPSSTPVSTVQKSAEDETELKRPKLGGLAFPFSLKQEGASASMVTLTSSVGVQPAVDVRTEGTNDSGVEANATDIEASKAARRSSGVAGLTDEDAADGPSGRLAVENGVVVSADRPPIETFVSAAESLPTASGV